TFEQHGPCRVGATHLEPLRALEARRQSEIMQNSPDVENLEIEVDLFVPGQQRGELEAPLTVRGNVRWAGGVHEVSRLPRPLRIGRLDKSGRHERPAPAGARAG